MSGIQCFICKEFIEKKPTSRCASTSRSLDFPDSNPQQRMPNMGGSGGFLSLSATSSPFKTISAVGLKYSSSFQIYPEFHAVVQLETWTKDVPYLFGGGLKYHWHASGALSGSLSGFASAHHLVLKGAGAGGISTPIS